MSDTPKRIEQEPLYPCCQCYDEYSWPKEDLRWHKNDLWCANCFDELDEDGERMLWSDLEPFVPKCDRELAELKADRVAISQRLSDALDALFAFNKQLAEARAEINIIEHDANVLIGDIKAELERKNKLIEQIKSEVERGCQGCASRAMGCRDYCLEGVVLDLIEGKDNAALSAAERWGK